MKQKQLGVNGQLHISSVTALVRSKDTQGEALRAKPDLLSGANGGMQTCGCDEATFLLARLTERCLDSLRTALNLSNSNQPSSCFHRPGVPAEPVPEKL